MPKISNKGAAMPASPIRKLVPFADQAKKEGVRIYHLNIGQPDIKTPEIALEAVKNYEQKVISYLHSEGSEKYRLKLKSYYQSVGVNLSEKDILVTTGGSEALLFGLLSCLDPDDEIIIPEPFYANYNGFTTAGNIKVVPIQTSIENGFALPPIGDFEAKITNKTKAILICNPNNPTGYLYSKSELETLKEIALKYDLFLFVDEVYREFVYDGAVHTSIMSLEGLEEHAIVIDSISKRYSACGARIGALVTKNKSVIQTALKFAQARLSPPTYSEVLAEAALDTPASYFEEVKAEYLNRRNTLVNGLNKLKGVYCPNPGGAFYVMCKLPIDDADKFCQWILECFSYQDSTVMLAPGTGFYATKGLGHNEVRMAYVLNVDDLHRSISILEKALELYPGRIDS